MSIKKALPILFAVMFMVMLGFGIIIPVLPFFAKNMGATETELGLLMAVYSLMQFLFAPMWGRLSDRIGRKPVMLIGIAGLSLSFFLFAVSTELWMLFAARIIAGFLSAANMPTVMAYVADITTPEKRGMGMGIVGAAVGLGFTFGPGLGGIFSEESFATPFFISGCVAAATFLLVLFVLEESLTPDKRSAHKEQAGRFAGLGGSVVYLYVLMMFVSLSLAGLEATFAYFGAERAGLNPKSLGYVFVIMGLAGVVVQGGLVGRLIKQLGELRVMMIGLVLSGTGFGLILLTNSFWTAAVFVTIFGIGNGLMRPSVSSLITKRTTLGQGNAAGQLSSFESLGRIAGPVLGGALFTLDPDYPYLSGVALTFVAFMFYLVYRSRDKGEAPAH